MSSLRRHIGVLGQIAGFYLIHFLFFGRHFVDGSAILVGDLQIAISLNNLATYTLNTYHEFLWWDPTGLDGYPALVNLTHGWFQLFEPPHIAGPRLRLDRHIPLALAARHGRAGSALLPCLSEFTHIRSPNIAGANSFGSRAPVPASRLHAGRLGQPVLHACPARPGPGPDIGLSVWAHLFLATSHALVTVRLHGLSVLLRRVHQLHHVLQSSVPTRPVHDFAGCVHSEFSVLRLDRIAGSDENRPG